MTQESPKPKVPITPEMRVVLGYLQDQLHKFSGEIRGEVARLEQRIVASQPEEAGMRPAAPAASVSEAVTLNDQGVALFYRNEQQEALAVLERATQLDPQLLEAWNNLAMVYSALGQAEKAQHAFAHAVEQDANRTEVLNNRGVLHLLAGDVDSALSMLEQAEQTNPRFIPTLLNLALAYQMKGQHERAIRTWKMVVVIDSGNEEAKQNLRQYYQ